MNRLVFGALVGALVTIPVGAVAQLRAADHPAPPATGPASSSIPEDAAPEATPSTEEAQPWYLQGDDAEGSVDMDFAPGTVPAVDAEEPAAADAEAEAEAPAEEPEEAETNEEPEGLEVLGEQLTVDPFATVVGGAYGQFINNRTDIPDEREDRFTTVALTRLGMRARWGQHVSLISEFELNAGPYGTSVWEGQAAIQIRNQLLRVEWEGLQVDVGRVTDPASLDYFSVYVANMLLTDDLTRFPLLISGFNRGNGILARYELVEGLKVGFTVNAGNPTSTTGTVMVGGTFPPFARFYEVPWSNVGRDARGFPTSSFHVVLLSPSVTYENEFIRAQAAFQYFDANTNTNSESDEHIDGYNVRLGVQGRIWDGRIRPFANFSRVENDVVDPADLARLSNESYVAYTAGGGLDFDIIPGVLGAGGQYVWVREQQGEDTVFTRFFVNAGASVSPLQGVWIDARYGWGLACEDHLCGQNEEHRAYLTLRGVLGQVGQTGRRP